MRPEHLDKPREIMISKTHRYTHIQAERDRDTETEAETEKDSQKERKHPGAF